MTRTPWVAAAALAATLLTSQPARAQVRYDFSIPFDFVASGRTFTAGQYVLAPSDNGNVMTLTPRDSTAGSVVLPVETRLAERTPLNEPEVVFDKLNGKTYISELLVPGDDGYLLLVTKSKHTHESLKGSRGRS